MATESEARAIKSRHSSRLLQMNGVSGVGVERDGEGNYFLSVHVDSDDPQITANLPKEIDGIEVRTVRSGPFRKL